MEKRVGLTGVLIVFLVTILTNVQAQEYALDVRLDKQMYSVGEDVKYEVVLLEDSVPITGEVALSFSDASNKTFVQKTITSNKEQLFFIEEEYSSGYWKVEATYKGKTVKRFFSIGEREEVEFLIRGDKLVIKNNGNVPYTRTVQILIGEKIITQNENIPVGASKEIRLIAPNGNYNIQVTDGKQTITRTGVALTGTGNVIGALDDELANSQQPILGGIREGTESEAFVIARHVSPAFIFVGAVGMLAVLLFFERMARRKAHERIVTNIHTLQKSSS